jgi:quinol monooxygenase YgiN/uncharacterized protein (DUF1330 family)
MLAAMALMLPFGALSQQQPRPYVRWAELETSDLAALQAAGRANIAASIATEPGVLALHSAVEKANPARMRVLEVYASADAYQAHVQSAHFQKFVRETQGLLRNRAVFDTTPVLLGAKPNMPAATGMTHVRVAEIEIHPAHLDAYKAAVSEEISDSIRLEPGVLAIYCVALKDRPTQLRFFEVYADESAYRSHIETSHFKKYVDTTKTMILDRKLFEMDAAILAARSRAPAYYIAEFELTDLEGIKPYSAAVESTFTPFGGRYVVRGGKVSSLEGAPAKRVIMIAFPSIEQAQAWYDSPAYRAILPIRHKSANSRVFIMDGFAP